MHKNNKHKTGYNFEKLISVFPELENHVSINKQGTETIDFANPKAVKMLNTALLKADYGLNFWEFPNANLCPPIPGRADYIHVINDLLQASVISQKVTVLDIGTGATCIYPLLGNAEYNWNFVASDCDETALVFAEKIISENKLTANIQLRKQKEVAHIFENIITKTDRFDASLCNPPFYKNESEALEATKRKLKGLGKETGSVTRNFAGKANELWFKGGEKAFLHTYLYESSLFKKQCYWYTSLVSNKAHIKSMYTSLAKLGATCIKTIDMAQGNKKSRVVAWSFLTEKEQKDWVV